MVDFVVRVIVDPGPAQRGLRNVEQGLNRVNRAAERTNELIRTAVAAAGGFAGAQAITSYADELISLQNRLRLVTDSTENLKDVTADLFEVSNDTRAAFSATAVLYSRTATATQALGLSQQDTLNFTRQLNQAVALSGATANEAQNAIVQLSQGLAAGALRGEEFNSVSEQLPRVLQVIADQTGKTIGELRAFAAEGKITAELVVEAFSNAAEELQTQFNTTGATIGQAFTVINNRLQEITLEFLNTTKLAETFAGALLDLGNNLPIVIEGLTALTVLLGVRLASFAIPAAIVGITQLAFSFGTLLVGQITQVTSALSVLGFAFLRPIDLAIQSIGALSLAFGGLLAAASRLAISLSLVPFQFIVTATLASNTALARLVAGFTLATGAVTTFSTTLRTVIFAPIIAGVTAATTSVIAFATSLRTLTFAGLIASAGAAAVSLRALAAAFVTSTIASFSASLTALNAALVATVARIRLLGTVAVGLPALGAALASVSAAFVTFGAALRAFSFQALITSAGAATASVVAFGRSLVGLRLAGVVSGITSLTAAFATLTRVLLVNPFIILATTFTTLIALVFSFENSLLSLGGDFTELVDTTTAFLELVFEGFKNVVNAVLPAEDKIEDLSDVFNFLARVATASINAVVSGFDVLVAASSAALAAIRDPLNAIEASTAAFNRQRGAIEELFQARRQEVTIRREETLGAERYSEALRELEALGPSVAEAVAKPNPALKRQQELLDQIQGPIKQAQQDLITLRQLYDAGKISLDVFNRESERLNKIINPAAIEAQTKALDEQQAILDQIRGPQEQYTKNLAILDRLLKQGRISTEEYNNAIRELRLSVLESDPSLNSAADGYERFFARLRQDAQTSADFVDDSLSATLDGLSGAFERFANTGKFSFRDLTNSILQDVNRLASRGVAEQILGSLGGASGGGGFNLFGAGSSLLGGLSGALPFANDGADIRIGGNAGRDNNLLSINGQAVARVSRGETISVTPQERESGSVTVNMTVVTRDAESFQRSQQQIASSAAQALDRARRRNT